jgi:hypothetical protein
LLGREHGDRFWAIYELMRQEHDYVDFPATIERLHLEHPEEQRLPEVSELLMSLPFDHYLYPGALETLATLGALGPVVIVSDGDAVYQPRKIGRSGVTAAVDGRVLIFVHKQRELPEVQRRHPADHYVLIDDKPSILADVKQRWGDRVTTVLVTQGQYAHSAALAHHRRRRPQRPSLVHAVTAFRLTRSHTLRPEQVAPPESAPRDNGRVKHPGPLAQEVR